MTQLLTDHPVVGAVLAFLASFTLSVLVWNSVAVVVLPLGGYDAVIIDGDSMRPTLRPGDVLGITDPAEDTLGYGRVVTFTDPTGQTVTHRIRHEVDGGYLTRGDANVRNDSDVVRYDDIIGVAEVAIPAVAGPVVWARDGDWVKLVPWLTATSVALWVSIAYRTVTRPDRTGRRRRRWLVAAGVIGAGAMLTGSAATSTAALVDTTGNVGNAFASGDVADPTDSCTYTATGSYGWRYITDSAGPTKTVYGSGTTGTVPTGDTLGNYATDRHGLPGVLLDPMSTGAASSTSTVILDAQEVPPATATDAVVYVWVEDPVVDITVTAVDDSTGNWAPAGSAVSLSGPILQRGHFHLRAAAIQGTFGTATSWGVQIDGGELGQTRMAFGTAAHPTRVTLAAAGTATCAGVVETGVTAGPLYWWDNTPAGDTVATLDLPADRTVPDQRCDGPGPVNYSTDNGTDACRNMKRNASPTTDPTGTVYFNSVPTGRTGTVDAVTLTVAASTDRFEAHVYHYDTSAGARVLLSGDVAVPMVDDAGYADTSMTFDTYRITLSGLALTVDPGDRIDVAITGDSGGAGMHIAYDTVTGDPAGIGAAPGGTRFTVQPATVAGPTGLTAVAADEDGSGYPDDITVSFTASSDDPDVVTHYAVWRCTGVACDPTGGGVRVGTVPVGDPTVYVDADVAVGDYRYAVVAHTTTGVTGTSTPVGVTVEDVPVLTYYDWCFDTGSGQEVVEMVWDDPVTPDAWRPFVRGGGEPSFTASSDTTSMFAQTIVSSLVSPVDGFVSRVSSGTATVASPEMSDTTRGSCPDPTVPDGITAVVTDNDGDGWNNDVTVTVARPAGQPDHASYDVRRCSGAACGPSVVAGNVTVDAPTGVVSDKGLFNGLYRYDATTLSVFGRTSSPTTPDEVTVAVPSSVRVADPTGGTASDVEAAVGSDGSVVSYDLYRCDEAVSGVDCDPVVDGVLVAADVTGVGNPVVVVDVDVPDGTYLYTADVTYSSSTGPVPLGKITLANVHAITIQNASACEGYYFVQFSDTPIRGSYVVEIRNASNTLINSVVNTTGTASVPRGAELTFGLTAYVFPQGQTYTGPDVTSAAVDTTCGV